MANPFPNDPSEAFVRALTESQTALRGYCQASLGHTEEAKEALQRTSIVLWKKQDHWNPETSFLPWAFSTVPQFRSLMVEQQGAFTRCLTEKLMIYALGRELDLRDRPVIDSILEQLEENQGGLRDLIEAIVLTDTFASN